MPLAIMLQRKQNHPLGVTVTIILSSIFLLFQPTLKNNNNNISFTIHFSKKVFMTQQSLQETIRAQKRQEGAGQRERLERESKNTSHILRIYPIGNRTSKALSQLPYALTKIPTAAVRPGSCFIISPSPSSGGNSFSPMLDFH